MTASSTAYGRRAPGRLALAGVAVAVVLGCGVGTAWLSRSVEPWRMGILVALVVLAAVAGTVAGVATRRTAAAGEGGDPSPDSAPGRPAPAPVVHETPQPATPQAGTDQRLVERVLEVRDLLANEALRARLDDGIRSAGFELIAPRPGDPFDPAVHLAVDTEPVTDGSTPGTVAATEHVGLRRQGHLHRRAAVVVWEARR